jgi:hypothetical protein
LFAVVGLNGSILTSPAITTTDTPTWTAIRAKGSPAFEGIAYGDSTFVAVGQSGAIQISTDDFATTRAITTSGVTTNLLGVTYGDGLFVAVGGAAGTASAPIITSTDGITWTVQNSHTLQTITSVSYGDAGFVAVGNQVVLTSTNGVTWTANTGLPHAFEGVTFGHGVYAAVTVGGLIFTSPDGETWTKQRATGTQLYGITYGGGYFVVVGAEGVIISSPDGIIWSRMKSKTAHDLEAVAFGSGNGKFIAAGTSSVILQSNSVGD